MMFARSNAREKRAAFREAVDSGELLRFPGAFSPLVSKLVERLEFEGVYVSGAALSADLGLPDVGLTTLSEVAERGGLIARGTDLPAIIDVDTGFGEPINAARTVRTLEQEGLCGMHLEDQESPKRCGHLDEKRLIPERVMRQKIAAARRARTDENFLLIARTDARAVEGMDAAIERARSYVDAGAEMIFPEALRDEEEFAHFRTAVDVPLLANMTEFGKSKLLNARKLQELGYSIVIYPVTTLRLAMKAVEEGLHTIDERGDQIHLLERMQHREELYDLIEYERYRTFDGRVALASEADSDSGAE